MKINIFKVDNASVDDLVVELENNGYDAVSDLEDDDHYMVLYLKRKSSETQGWIDFYKPILEDKEYKEYSQNLGSETLAGVYLIEKDTYCYAVTHGQSHFIVRKYCDKDFGLNLAERIVDPVGLKMKHSQTFTSASKKDITSYTHKRKLDSSFEYGEAFSYVKCKTVDKKLWGETTDFGESARFTSGKDFSFKAKTLFELADRIDSQLVQDPIVRLPRYKKVTDKAILEILEKELKKRFLDFLTDVDTEDYWLTGVSFNFSSDYKYSLKIYNHDLTEITDNLDVTLIKKCITDNEDKIKERYDLIKVRFYDEDDEFVFSRALQDLLQITIDYDNKYYVLFHNEWVEFSDSYVKFIEEQVDGIDFEIKDHKGLSETDLIADLVGQGLYTQLHKNNVYIGKNCVEQADLMDNNNVIMIKDQCQQADLVYLVKQATTSIRLTDSGELQDKVYNGKNVCLWMLVNRKTLRKLSDFKSFHLLDALNDFKKEAISKNLNPVVWISLKK